jgi:hypothetical protein
MAFSPSGVLHVIDGTRVASVSQGSAQTVIETSSRYLLDLAFDKDGYLYVSTELGGVLLYDPSYQMVSDPFAITNIGLPMSILFARDASGGMTSRLLVMNGNYNVSAPYAGALLEVNPAGVRAAGHPLQPRLLRVASESLQPARMGTDYADTLRVLDAAGPFTWQLTGGAVPPGLTLDPASGVLAGVPTQKGTFAFAVRVEGNARFGNGEFTVQVGEPTLAIADVTSAILGVTGLLSPDEERFLDLQGNNNGQLDIGDVRAYLRARGQLPAAVAAPVFERKEDK